MENEYEILPRFAGPVCSMFAAARLTALISPEIFAPAGGLQQIPELMESVSPAADELDAFGEDLRAGANFFFTNSASQYAQNLSCKILETLFRRPPQILDALTYAHGPFQLDSMRPGANWIFLADNAEERKLSDTLAPLFERGGTFRRITSPLPPPCAIFYYEAFLNALLLHSLQTLDVDLADWPGKGRDGEGYGIREPGFPS